MAVPSFPTRSKLVHVMLEENGEKTQLVFTFEGSLPSLLAAQDKLSHLPKNSSLYSADVILSADRQSLTLTASLNEELTAVDLLKAVQDATHCRLGGVELELEVVAFPHPKQTFFQPTVTIRRKPGSDPSNDLGELTEELILRHPCSQRSYAEDPLLMGGTNRIFDAGDMATSRAEAQRRGEQMMRDIEAEYGLFRHKELNLKLTEVHGAIHERDDGAPDHVAHATLRGDEASLRHARKRLDRRYGGQKTSLQDNTLEVTFVSDRVPLEPTDLLAAAHLATDCELPAHLSETTTRSHQRPYGYKPCIAVEAGPDTPRKHRRVTEDAVARYVRNYLPGEGHAVTVAKGEKPTRVIVNQQFAREENAQVRAEELGNAVRKQLARRGRVDEREL